MTIQMTTKNHQLYIPHIYLLESVYTNNQKILYLPYILHLEMDLKAM